MESFIKIVKPKPNKAKSRQVSVEKRESYQSFHSNFKKEQHESRKFYPKVVESFKVGNRSISPDKFKTTILDRFKKYEEKRLENLNKLREDKKKENYQMIKKEKQKGEQIKKLTKDRRDKVKQDPVYVRYKEVLEKKKAAIEEKQKLLKKG